MSKSTDSKSSPQVLVVDDVPDNLHLLKTILQQHGYHVRVAANGQFALRSLDYFHPDLILLDIMMPEMSGYTFCQKLKNNPRTSDIPVIFVSALQDGIDKAKAFQIGGADYLTKPFQVEELLARVKHHLSLRHLQIELQRKNQVLEAQNDQLQQSQRDMSLMLDITRIINKVFDINLAISEVLDRVRQHIAWDYAEAWIPNREKTELVYIPCQMVNHHRFETFQTISSQMVFHWNQGLPGKIWHSQESEWIKDCCGKYNPVFSRQELACDVGFRSLFGVPIISNSEVLCILIFYQTEQQNYHPNLVKLIQSVVTQLASPLEKSKLYQKLEEANHELEQLAHRDGLTKVANRRRFDDILAKEWLRLKREQGWLSLMLCDVDYFKKYNDRYGHLAGDRCLIEIAKVLSDSARRPADLVARYGGEEFAIILPNTDRTGASTVAVFLQEKMSHLSIPHQDSDVAGHVTLSLGINCAIPSDSLSIAEFIDGADRALYQAKQSGRNRFYCNHFTPESDRS